MKQIGLDRMIRLQWLERTASLAQVSGDDAAIKAILQTDLQDSFRSSNSDVRGSIDKTITILLKVWKRVPAQLAHLHENGLELLKRLPLKERIVVHWGMMMAVYPFWGNVAAQAGRLMYLQGSAAAAHVQRRVREQYGERETVARRVRYVLRSYVDWGVLQETSDSGVYSAAPTIAVEDTQLIAWLIEAYLHSDAKPSASLKEILRSPRLFPFRPASVNPRELTSASTNLDFYRHDLDHDYVSLRTNNSRA